MSDSGRITFPSHHGADERWLHKPWENLTPMMIASILALKAGGLLIAIALSVAGIVSQTHPEVINIRPIIEGIAVKNNVSNVTTPLSMAQLPTIVKQTQNAISQQLTAGVSSPFFQTTPTDEEPLQTAEGLENAGQTATIFQTPTLIPSLSITPTLTSTPTITFTSTPSKTPTFTPTNTIYPYSLIAYNGKMSVPLKGIGFGEIHTIISQLYNVPNQRSDEGHHGVDLGSYDYHGKLIYDWPILAVFSGKVAGITVNRIPIGNTVIIECPYNELPQEVIALLGITENQSLYHMYSHMLDVPTQKIGDSINVGEEIGRVGKSQTVEAHLHLEMVIGLSGQTVSSMSNNGTAEEAKTYMWWRTSGTFISFDPMILFNDLQ